ncbi:hypothetical protein WA026_003873 [Henosepilachna vigintioctopunctata]|uniref:Fatty acyl-CoA reductase n=1 Tax=Henosepilachna vigintioctopunctata TaxID=420089 RepID=A0AAW1UD44_9CUCU
MLDGIDKETSKIIHVNSEFECEDGSNIVQYYNRKTIFLTGATGFLGKLIFEKILRTCEGVKRIYILVRPKKGVNINDRIDQLFAGPAMDKMKEVNPNFKDQVSLVPGDLLLPYLGMSEKSIQSFKDEVNIVIHCGATVRFDQKLREAAYINVRSVRNLLDISKETNGLESFLYISTAYSHCPRSEIGEEFYDPPIEPDDLLKLVEMLDEKKLKEITPILLDEWPNTYSFTKAVAENLIKQESENLPLAIVRPSIVIGAVKEPIPGWIDSIYGPTGLIVFGMLGILRTIHGDPDAKCDLVPVDFVVNCIISAAYQRAKLNQMPAISSIYSHKMTPIFNYCYSPNLPSITWGSYLARIKVLAASIDSTRCLWYPAGEVRRCIYLFKIEKFFNMLPAHVADLVFKIMGREQIAVKLMERLFNTTSVLNYFLRRKWTFTTDNTQKLFESLSSTDKNLFDFNMDAIDFESYTKDYLYAMRIYIMKDPLETLEAGRRHVLKLHIIYYISWIVLFAILYMLYHFLSTVFM